VLSGWQWQLRVRGAAACVSRALQAMHA